MSAAQTPQSVSPVQESPDLDQFGRFQSMMSNLDCTDVPSGTPVFLDMFSGPNCPLSKALLWCGWSVVSPIDIAIDEDLDVTRPAVQNAIIARLPQVHATCAACSIAPPRLELERRDQVLCHCVMTLTPVVCLPWKGLTWSGSLRTIWLQTLAIQDWMHSCGRAALRENPLNSLHWKDPVEACLAESGEWMDLYDACVFHGARWKGQQIRHNVPELAQLPLLRCGHLHSSQEWKREGTSYPTKEEAEYTPSLVFTLAICLTAWAARQGYAITAIPRLPPIQASGDVRPLLAWPASALRSDLMTVMALHLGLRPEEARRRGVRGRLVAADVFQSSKVLPDKHVYIGPGHFSHRWQVGPWSNPFLAGKDGTHFETVLHYAEWLLSQPSLLAQLGSLSGCTLVCDCPHNRLCHGDVLAALVCDSHQTSAGSTGRSYHPSRWVQALLWDSYGLSQPFFP